MKVLMEAAKQLPQFGFIVSLKETSGAFKIVEEFNLTNVLLQKFVPQKKLLSDPRVMAFLSHCGGNSILESLYYGKAIIGHPLDTDQLGGAYRVERMGVGISLRKNPTLNTVVESIKKVLETPNNGSENKYQQTIKRVQRMIEFKELRSGKDMAYFMQRQALYHQWSGKKSSSHLFNGSVNNNNFITSQDYDIKLFAVILLLTASLLVHSGF